MGTVQKVFRIFKFQKDPIISDISATICVSDSILLLISSEEMFFKGGALLREVKIRKIQDGRQTMQDTKSS